jgi:hypothetical protein
MFHPNVGSENLVFQVLVFTHTHKEKKNRIKRLDSRKEKKSAHERVKHIESDLLSKVVV